MPDPLPKPTAASATADFPVVGVGASAGGLDACRRLLDALPSPCGLAMILVQHLDPAHDSLLVELLSRQTAMTVLQAADGLLIQPEHLYIIPPGVYLSVEDGALRLSEPLARHGARLPFDFLLRSLAKTYGPRAIAVVLSGTGADGSLGLPRIKADGGHVIAQTPSEAEFGDMPRNAIATGAVDEILSVAVIGDALRRRVGSLRAPKPAPTATAEGPPLRLILDLLSSSTGHDFRLYKSGTIQRRIERRMGMASIEAGRMDRYLDLLRADPREADLLSKDLLINVTGFFRDKKVFDRLADSVIPAMVRDRPADQPLRVWIAGCSTGEETYSIAMLLREAITAARRNVKLQIFASDIDAEAVAAAREGFYPTSIEADVTPERLARFFNKEETGYRVLPELRSSVVFAVQDLLVDPPFARLDLISCRNLLIYLLPPAQASIIALFHFALKESGVLVLGSAETAGDLEGRFEPIAKAQRIFRRIGYSRPGALPFANITPDGVRLAPRPDPARAPLRQSGLAELCRQMVVEAFAPAAVLVNLKHECLFSLGPTDRYLRVAPGHPTHDLLAMAREGLRAKLKSAMQQAVQTQGRVVVSGGHSEHGGRTHRFSLDVRPVNGEGEPLLLIGFIEAPTPEPIAAAQAGEADPPAVAQMEQEMAALRSELQSAIRELEISTEEQKSINEEALSVNEEYQSTNEELLTSKEELQSLNEELTALNGQLQETLEQQRTTSNDLQNVLYSTNVATLFLDRALKIRFFTPATKKLFNVIPGDIGRPLADLSALASDDALLSDAQAVLGDHRTREREIQVGEDAWYLRRILPYKTLDDGVEGVVITFADITAQHNAADAVSAAKRQADMANLAKSRFLAAASHDLRQPLQTLVLLQGLLAKRVEDEKAKALVRRLDETLGAMSGMLNTLLDINQIDAGTVKAQISRFPIKALLDRMRDEFSYHVQAQGLVLRVAPCSLYVDSDPQMLEQVVRNLLSNALKYTRKGRIVLGCRRRNGGLSIEVWDTGIGIPEADLKAIFDEYHQLNNPAREASLGFGLGLSIVQRMASLLGCQVRVRSTMGKGSVFAIDLPRPTTPLTRHQNADAGADATPAVSPPETPTHGVILVVEDDPDVRSLLQLLLTDEGHHPVVAVDGVAALALVAHGAVRPDLILADYNLPGGLNGLQLAAQLRASLHSQIPVIILTGDISTLTLRAIAAQNCTHLNKPVKLSELLEVVRARLPTHPLPIQADDAAAPAMAATTDQAVIYVVDDEAHIRESIRSVLEDEGRTVEDFADAEAFLEAFHPAGPACLLLDAHLPGMSGLELLRRLRAEGRLPAAIMITGSSDVPIAVKAMKAGAADFIEKPMNREALLTSVERALELSRDGGKQVAWRQEAVDHLASLTARQREIMDLVLAGHPNQTLAADLGVSQRTVENHRAAIMRKTGSKSLPALARLALTAASGGGPSGD